MFSIVLWFFCSCCTLCCTQNNVVAGTLLWRSHVLQSGTITDDLVVLHNSGILMDQVTCLLLSNDDAHGALIHSVNMRTGTSRSVLSTGVRCDCFLVVLILLCCMLCCALSFDKVVLILILFFYRGLFFSAHQCPYHVVWTGFHGRRFASG